MNLETYQPVVNGKTVVITFAPSPIPLRSFDYRAQFVGDDAFDVAGYGPTPEAAVEDLKSWDDLTLEGEAK